MKQKDWILILVVVFISGIFSFFLSGLLFGNSKNAHQQVEVVEKINASFPQPDPKYFNSQSIDPTQLIRIGDNTNDKPFKTGVAP